MYSTKEHTWGGELAKLNAEISWNPIEDEDDEAEEMFLSHCLFLKQAVLGKEAKEGERNIVEVETMDWNNKKIQQPIFSLKVDHNESCALDITLLPPVKLRLKHGSGPVYITGTHAMEAEEDEDYFLNGDTTEDDVAQSDASPDLKAKKRPASAVKGSSKKRRVDENGTDEDEEDEDESVEDEEEEDEEEEEEEGDEDEEEDEDEDEESMEEDDEEDEDSSPEKPKKKTRKGKQNGKGAKKEKKDGKVKKMTIDEIKEELTKGSIKPKNEEKFNNVVKTKYHLTNAKKRQELWNWYKTSQLSK